MANEIELERRLLALFAASEASARVWYHTLKKVCSYSACQHGWPADAGLLALAPPTKYG
jgi:hypothetical protein